MVIRRGIVVVHGVGSQQRADHLDLFTEPFVRFLGNAHGPENVELDVRPATDTSKLAWATIRLTQPRDNPCDQPEVLEEWHIREAWWARHFKPSGSKTVLFWGIMAGLQILRATWQHLAVRNWRRLRGQNPAQGEADFVLGRPWDFATSAPAAEEDQGVWTTVGAGRLRATIDLLIWLFWGIFYIVAAIAGLPLLLALYVFLLFPLSFVFPEAIGNIQRKITNLLVSSIGDQHAITTRRVAIGGAANEVERALWTFLHPDALRESRRGDPLFDGYDTVSVVAHSAGCVVSYDALCGRDVQEWLANMGSRPPEGMKPLSRINWVTVGSGLNLAWRMRRTLDTQDRAFWRELCGVNWLNIYARYDPVPQGAPPRALIETLVGADPMCSDPQPPPPQPGEPLPARPPYVNLRVANEDYLVTDHNRYWGNEAEVMSRIVHVIADSRLGSQPINPDDVTWLPTGTGDPPDGVSDHILNLASSPTSREHRRRVTWGALKRLVVFAVAVTVVATLAADVGAWAFGSDSLWGIAPVHIGDWSLGDLVPEKVGNIETEGVRDFLGGTLLIAYAGFVLGALAGLFTRWRRWARGMSV